MIHDDPIHGTGAHPVDVPPAKGSPVTRIVLVLLLIAAVGGVVWLVRARSKAAAAAAAAAASAMQNRIVPVLTADVQQRDVPVTREGLGSVAAFYTVTVKTQVDGRIDRVAFKEGQRVKKGDVLVQIDPRPFAIQLESAQAAMGRDLANLKNARVNLDRYKTLSQQNLIAVQQFTDQQASVDQLDAQLRADQASVDAAKLNLDYARITSPIDGVTGVRLVDPGNVVHASDTTGLVVVTQLDPIAVFFTLPEDDLPAISTAVAAAAGTPGLSVEALSRDGDSPLGQGTLSVIDNEINQQTATIRLKAIFDNPRSQLWPNQFVKARLHLSTRKNALVVPAAAVQHGPTGTFVYVATAAGVAEMRPVAVDATQGDLAVVKTGLSAGEQVVVEGQAQLRPGAKIAAKPFSSSGAPGPRPGSSGAPGGSSRGGPGAPPSASPSAPPGSDKGPPP